MCVPSLQNHVVVQSVCGVVDSGRAGHMLKNHGRALPVCSAYDVPCESKCIKQSMSCEESAPEVAQAPPYYDPLNMCGEKLNVNTSEIEQLMWGELDSN